jgi:hypothetical protein
VYVCSAINIAKYLVFVNRLDYTKRVPNYCRTKKCNNAEPYVFT